MLFFNVNQEGVSRRMYGGKAGFSDSLEAVKGNLTPLSSSRPRYLTQLKNDGVQKTVYILQQHKTE